MSGGESSGHKRLVTGTRAVMEALRGSKGSRPSVIYYDEKVRGAIREILNEAKKREIRCFEESAEALDELAQGHKHQGVVAIAGAYPYVELDDLLADLPANPLLVALDQITDPHNFGAIVRSAVAMGAHGIITLKDRAAPVTPIVVRSSAGATEHARIARVTNLARTLGALDKEGFQVVGLAGEAEHLLHELPSPTAGRILVVGSEGSGLRRLVRERCTILARIELPGPISSLNASVAAAIAIYESVR